MVVCFVPCVCVCIQCGLWAYIQCVLCFPSPQHPACHHAVAERVKRFLELYHSVSEGCVSGVKTPLNRDVGEAVRVCEKCRECNNNDSVMLHPYEKAAPIRL